MERECLMEQMTKTEKEILNQETITIVKSMNKLSVFQLEYRKMEKLLPINILTPQKIMKTTLNEMIIPSGKVKI